MNTGSPPTALKARTGELTPPGMTFCARSNRTLELGSLMAASVVPESAQAQRSSWPTLGPEKEGHHGRNRRSSRQRVVLRGLRAPRSRGHVEPLVAHGPGDLRAS